MPDEESLPAEQVAPGEPVAPGKHSQGRRGHLRQRIKKNTETTAATVTAKPRKEKDGNYLRRRHRQQNRDAPRPAEASSIATLFSSEGNTAVADNIGNQSGNNGNGRGGSMPGCNAGNGGNGRGQQRVRRDKNDFSANRAAPRFALPIEDGEVNGNVPWVDPTGRIVDEKLVDGNCWNIEPDGTWKGKDGNRQQGNRPPAHESQPRRQSFGAPRPARRPDVVASAADTEVGKEKPKGRRGIRGTMFGGRRNKSEKG